MLINAFALLAEPISDILAATATTSVFFLKFNKILKKA